MPDDELLPRSEPVVPPDLDLRVAAIRRQVRAARRRRGVAVGAAALVALGSGVGAAASLGGHRATGQATLVQLPPPSPCTPTTPRCDETTVPLPTQVGSSRPGGAAPRTDSTPALRSTPLEHSPSTSPSTPSSNAPSIGSCTTAQLAASAVDENGAGQHYYILVAVENVGTASCTITGFFTVAGYDGSSATFGSATPRGSSGSVTLAHDATAVFRVIVPTTDGADGCPTSIDRLRVTPPGQTGAETVPFGRSLVACSSGAEVEAPSPEGD